jgi:hypothetical protein
MEVEKPDEAQPEAITEAAAEAPGVTEAATPVSSSEIAATVATENSAAAAVTEAAPLSNLSNTVNFAYCSILARINYSRI